MKNPFLTKINNLNSAASSQSTYIYQVTHISSLQFENFTDYLCIKEYFNMFFSTMKHIPRKRRI